MLENVYRAQLFDCGLLPFLMFTLTHKQCRKSNFVGLIVFSIYSD